MIDNQDIDQSITLTGHEAISTFGGEAWVDDIRFAEYGLSLGGHHIHGLTPTQAINLASVLVDHLILCGHRFEIVKTGEQDQREQLICVDKELDVSG